MSRYSFLFLCALALVFGCEQQGTRRTVSGAVNWKNAPLDQGTITFNTDSTPPTTAGGARIDNGRYSLPAEMGLEPGKYRVQISSVEGVSVTPEEYAAGKVVPPPKERLAPQYNVQSTLTIEVTKDGKNQFDFNVE